MAPASVHPMSLGERVVRALRRDVKILPFHADWIRHAYAEDIEVAALSCPRGSAKTWICGHLAALAITPGSPTYEKGIEVLAVSASLEQSRIILSFVREALAAVEDDYRWLDSGQRLTVTRKECRTRLRILSSSGKRAMGLSQFTTVKRLSILTPDRRAKLTPLSGTAEVVPVANRGDPRGFV